MFFNPFYQVPPPPSPQDLAKQHNDQGHLYWLNKQYSQAIEAHLAAINILNSQEEQHKNPFYFAMSYYGLVQNYLAIGDYANVDHYANMVKECVDRCNNEGINYSQAGDFVAAFFAHQKALAILYATYSNNFDDLILSYNYMTQAGAADATLGTILLDATKAFVERCNIIAVNSKNLELATKFAEKSLEITVVKGIFAEASLSTFNSLSFSYQNLAKQYESKKELALAIKAYERIIQVNGILYPQLYNPDIAPAITEIHDKIKALNQQIQTLAKEERIEALGRRAADNIADIRMDEIIKAGVAAAFERMMVQEWLNDAVANIEQEVLADQVADNIVDIRMDEIIKAGVVAAFERMVVQARLDDAVGKIEQEALANQVADNIVDTRFDEMINAGVAAAFERAVVQEWLNDAIGNVVARQEDILGEEVTGIVADRLFDEVIEETIAFAIKKRKENQKKNDKKALKAAAKKTAEKEAVAKEIAAKEAAEKEAAEKEEKSLENQVRKANELNMQAKNYYEEGNFDQSIISFKNALEILSVNGVSSAVAETYSYIGDVYLAKGEYDNSIAYYKRSLISYDLIYNNAAHLDTMTALDKLSFAYIKVKKIEEASGCFSRMLGMIKTLHQTAIRPETAMIFKTMKHIYIAKFAIESGFIASLRAFQIIAQFPDHDLRQAIENEMGMRAIALAIKYRLNPAKLFKVIADHVHDYKFTIPNQNRLSSSMKVSKEELKLTEIFNSEANKLKEESKFDKLVGEMASSLAAVETVGSSVQPVYLNSVFRTPGIFTPYILHDLNKVNLLIANGDNLKANEVRASFFNYNQDLHNIGFFAVKETIENLQPIKYVAIDILHLDALMPEPIKQIGLPIFSNLIWTVFHYVTFTIGMQPLGGGFNKAILFASALQGSKFYFNDYIFAQKQAYIAENYNKSEGFVDKCGYLMGLQLSIDYFKRDMNKLIVPSSLESFPGSTLAIGVTIEGLQCYKLHKQTAVSYKASVISQVTPYIADVLVFLYTGRSIMKQNAYLREQHGHHDKFETIMKMVYIVEAYTLTNTVVAIDQISKLAVFAVEEAIIPSAMAAIDYMGELCNYYLGGESQ